MHLFLTDRITCPRCGPEFGLILLAHQVQDRRVVRGDFGCANCRENYPVEEGFGDLRTPPRLPPEDLPEPTLGPAASALSRSEDAPLRLAALMGVTEGPGTLLLTGPLAGFAGSVVQIVGGVEAVALDASLKGQGNQSGVSRMISRPGLPFFSDTFLGVVVSGENGRSWVAEAARVLSPGRRIAVLDALRETRAWLEPGGFKVILEEDGVLVAEKGRGDRVPLVPLRRS